MRSTHRRTKLKAAVVLFAALVSPAIAEEHTVRSRAAVPIPAPLRDFWLDFHESELCQAIDAVFVLYEQGMEVWCLTDDSRAADRLRQRAEPLRGSFQVELYVTRRPRDQNTRDDRQPPPSLWNNEHLRTRLQEAALRPPAGVPVAGEERNTALDPEFLLKSRIQMFADQTLEANRRLMQYARDLRELSRLSLDPAAQTGAAARARSVLLSHAAGLNRSLDRLYENLGLALRTSSQSARQGVTERSSEAGARPPETVEEIVRASESIHRGVYRFIYPDEHTVGVADLREPNLLGSLAELRGLVLALLKRR